MTHSHDCLHGFEWDGVPTGHVGHLASHEAYITGDNPDVAILFIADLLGWKFKNARLLADHFARETPATVYVPDFFGGETLPQDLILAEKWDQIDLAGFRVRNSRAIREPEIFECARALRDRYPKVGAVGYCYGGWAVMRLGAKGTGGHDAAAPLVDAVVAGHPTFLTRDDIDGVAAPVQLLAPEIDFQFTPDLKLFAFETLQKHAVPFDYQHLPGVKHGCLSRGDPNISGEREAMVRGKNAAVGWFQQFLHSA
ncbi:hypothetical protein VTN49DRAFT_4597 [Thermomyces lanuginosus]|uniref:uncharacterized protein n=1 Tax=Thermomyces lanuginosus TaxID=5541 RepID=UPI003742A075